MLRPRNRAFGEGGAVTAETAVVLPALAVVLLLCLWSLAAVAGQLSCVDAARVAARAVARGDPEQQAMSAARAAAPRGARVTVHRSGEDVVVEVRAMARLPGPWAGRGPSIALVGRAVAQAEEVTGDAAAVPP
jgi:hypothetical protein